jgi:hypothetical protein
MGSLADRAAERRRVKLEEIERLVKDGSLSIRQMTPAEREAEPPRERRVRRPGGLKQR